MYFDEKSERENYNVALWDLEQDYVIIVGNDMLSEKPAKQLRACYLAVV